MEIIQGTRPIDKIFKLNPGKKIGKVNLNYNKMIDDKILIHDGYKDMIQQLRLVGMDIIILEFFNTSNIYKSLNEWSNKVVPIIEQSKVLTNCITEKLDVNYVIYDSNDFKTDADIATIKLVDDRLLLEDYKNKLKILDMVYPTFRDNLIFITKRNSSNLTHVRSYKTGVDSFVIKHYLNKYMVNCDLLITHPIMFENTYFPLGTNNFIEEIKTTHQSTFDFLNYFHQIKKNSIMNSPNDVQADLEQYAISLNNSIEDFIIINDIDFVGIDKVYISMSFNGNYGSRIFVNKWL